MIGFPQKTLQELELEKMYPVQANAGIGFPQGTPQSIGMNTMYPVQNKAVVPTVNSNQGQMQAQPQPKTGLAGIMMLSESVGNKELLAEIKTKLCKC